MSEEEKDEYSLKESAEGVGELVPVIKDAFGNVIDGFHRLRVDPNWPAIRLTRIDDPVKLELARLAVNFCRRRVPKEELQAKIEFLIRTGGLTPEEIARKTGISLRTIYRYMPEELKSDILGRPKKQDILPVGKISEISRQEEEKQAITIPSSVPVPKVESAYPESKGVLESTEGSTVSAPQLPKPKVKPQLSLAEISDKLAKYYPLSFIDWVYEFCQFTSVEQGVKWSKRFLEAVWDKIERDFGEEWIRNVAKDVFAK